jgi:hypothetical protein
MTDVSELRRQRAELDQRIAAAEQAQAERWAEALDGVSRMLHADWPGLEESGRKNVTTLSVPGPPAWVRVSLAYPDGGCSASLEVEWDYGRCEFPSQWSAPLDPPPPAAVLVLVRALVKAQEASA